MSSINKTLQRKSLLLIGKWDKVYLELGRSHITEELRAQIKQDLNLVHQVGDIDRSLDTIIQFYCPKPKTRRSDFY
jgi:hypothetical protein